MEFITVNITLSLDEFAIRTLNLITSIICLKFNKAGFDEYYITKPLVIGINVENLCKIMK